MSEYVCLLAVAMYFALAMGVRVCGGYHICITYIQTYVKALCAPQITQIGLVQLESVCLVLVALRCLVFGVRWVGLLVQLFGRYAADMMNTYCQI